MANIKLIDVKKSYVEGQTTIENLNLEINDGEFVVLLGPTGSGKSAILRLIAGLDTIDEGSLYIGDTLSNELMPKDRNLAMVFQNQQLLPANVYEDIAFGLKLRKLSYEEINIKVREIARILDIENILQRKPKTLTALERQRVTLARALVRDPNVCLFDDVLASLDDTLTKRVRSELIKLQYRLGSTFIYATRDQIDAMTMASRLIVLNNGKIEQDGTPKDIYLNPKTVFVASYIGSPNIALFSANLVKTDSGASLEMLGKTFELPTSVVSKIKEVKDLELTVGIRPEDMKIVETDGDITATVDSVDNYGAYKVATLKLDQKTLNDFSVIISAETELEANKEVQVKFNFEKMHLFERESEETIFS